MPFFISGALSINVGGKAEIDQKSLPRKAIDEFVGIKTLYPDNRAYLKPIADIQLNLGFEINSIVSIYGIMGVRSYELETRYTHYDYSVMDYQQKIIHTYKKSEKFIIKSTFYGGGAEVLLRKNLFIFGEYTVGTKPSSDAEDTLPGQRHDMNYSIQKTEAIKVGARYYFK